ncbi:hypothetical protein WJU16_10205 [Chitinophaga pollutisoli]|uniref:ABC-2 family transporter protein n=1 Tax=Chitinophaga pollutisoli TaxID=3133966 RepID=A0ABZ2YVB6_9BACT
MKFSFQRCVLLFRMQLVTDRKIFGYGALALFAILLSFLLYSVYTNDDGLYYDKQKEVAETGLILFIFTMAAWCFRSLHSRSTRLQALMLPVTAVERFAVGIFFSVVIFPIVYLLVYLLSAGVAFYIDDQVFQSGNRFFYFQPGPMGFDWRGFLSICSPLLAIGWAASATYRRLAIPKAIATFALLFITINFFGDVFGKWLLESLPITESMRAPLADGRLPEAIRSYSHGAFSTWSFATVDANNWPVRNYTLEVPAWLQWVEKGFGILIPLVLLVVTVLKLREQELS